MWRMSSPSALTTLISSHQVPNSTRTQRHVPSAGSERLPLPGRPLGATGGRAGATATSVVLAVLMTVLAALVGERPGRSPGVPFLVRVLLALGIVLLLSQLACR